MLMVPMSGTMLRQGGCQGGLGKGLVQTTSAEEADSSFRKGRLVTKAAVLMHGDISLLHGDESRHLVSDSHHIVILASCVRSYISPCLPSWHCTVLRQGLYLPHLVQQKI